MGKRIRRNYDEHFKTRVVLEVLKGQKTLSQLSGEYELQSHQISDWKNQVVKGIPSLFGTKKVLISEEEKEELLAPLYEQIGQLKVENEFLKKKLRKSP